jgi:hypothetical protein
MSAGYPEPGGQEFTSGHSGTDTSRDRALTESRSGTTKQRQRLTLRYVGSFGATGLTVKTLREITGWHHGQASATLSNLHKAGSICRLAQTRDKCKVYVTPDWTLDRPTEAFNSRGKSSKDSEPVNVAQIANALTESDAMTANDGETLYPDHYIVDSENVGYLVETVLRLAGVKP